jgi:hypothetical protein
VWTTPEVTVVNSLEDLLPAEPPAAASSDGDDDGGRLRGVAPEQRGGGDGAAGGDDAVAAAPPVARRSGGGAVDARRRSEGDANAADLRLAKAWLESAFAAIGLVEVSLFVSLSVCGCTRARACVWCMFVRVCARVCAFVCALCVVLCLCVVVCVCAFVRWCVCSVDHRSRTRRQRATLCRPGRPSPKRFDDSLALFSFALAGRALGPRAAPPPPSPPSPLAAGVRRAVEALRRESSGGRGALPPPELLASHGLAPHDDARGSYSFVCVCGGEVL